VKIIVKEKGRIDILVNNAGGRDYIFAGGFSLL